LATKEELKLAEQLSELLSLLNKQKAQTIELDESALDILQEQNKEVRENEVLLQQVKAAQQAIYDLERETIIETGKRATQFEKAVTSLRTAASVNERQLQTEKDRARLASEKVAQQVENLVQLEREGSLSQTQREQLEGQLAASRAQLAEQNSLVDSLQEQADALAAAVVQAAKLADAQRSIADSTENMLGSITGITKTSFDDSFIGKLSEVGLAQALNTVGQTMGETLSFANALGAGFDKVVQASLFDMVTATDQAQASFFKATGTGEEYRQVITSIREEAVSMGVNIGDASAVTAELFTNMAMFSDMSKQAQVELGAFVGTMDQMGISTQTSTKILDSGTKSLGLSVNESKNLASEIAKTGKELGVSIAQISDGFADALPVLAKYGSEAAKVFKGLAAQAKATGIATQDLLGITEQFDTFQGAAESVGRLNGILGGNYLNSLEMVNMSEEERIRSLVRTMELSGKNFNSMSRLERQAVAASIGISDMDKANRLLGSSLDELDAKMGQTDAGMFSAEEQQRMADASRDTMAKIENIMQSLAVATQPIVNAVNAILEGILLINNALEPFGGLGTIILGVAAAYAILRFGQRQNVALSATEAAARLMNIPVAQLEMRLRENQTATLMRQAGATEAQIAALGRERAANAAGAASEIASTSARKASTASTGASTIATLADAQASVAAGAAKRREALATAFSTIQQKLKAAALIAAVPIVAAATAAQSLYTAAINTSASALMRNIAITLKNAGLYTLTAAKLAFATTAKVAFSAATATMNFLMGSQTVRLIAGAAAQGVYNVAAMAGSAATFVLSGAMSLLAIASTAAMGPIGLAVAALLALGVALFVSLHSPPLIIGLAILATLMIGLAVAAGFAALPMKAFGIAMLFVGAGVALVSVGAMLMAIAFEKVLEATTGVFDSLAGGVGALLDTASAVSVLAVAMAGLGIGSVLKFVALTEGFENLADIGPEAGVALVEVANVVRATSNVDTAKVESVKELADELGTLAITATVAPGLAVAAMFMNAIAGPEGGADDGGGQDVYLVMDGDGTKVIAKAVDVYLNKKHNVITRRS